MAAQILQHQKTEQLMLDSMNATSNESSSDDEEENNADILTKPFSLVNVSSVIVLEDAEDDDDAHGTELLKMSSVVVNKDVDAAVYGQPINNQEDDDKKDDDDALNNIISDIEVDAELMNMLEDTLLTPNISEIEQRIPFYPSDLEKKLFEVIETETRHSRYRSRSQFQPFVSHPTKSQKSIQIQRLSYILKHYQSFNNNKDVDEKCFIYHFIKYGNVNDRYNTEALLNDFYFALVHYTEDDFKFARLYEYICSEMGTLCDIKQCQFLHRHHLSNDMKNKKAIDYYGFSEPQQTTRTQLLDRIHSYFLHSYDVGFRLTKSEKHQIEHVR